MVRNSMRLVHSSDPSDKAISEAKRWRLEHATQLNLFQELQGPRIFFLPMAEISSHVFIKALEERAPLLLVDTRKFPDFFSVFVSMELAFEEFRRRGIEYCRVSLNPLDFKCGAWGKLEGFKSVVASHLKNHYHSSIFVLTSTKNNLHEVSNRLTGYIAQEIVDANFEEIAH